MKYGKGYGTKLTRKGPPSVLNAGAVANARYPQFDPRLVFTKPKKISENKKPKKV